VEENDGPETYGYVDGVEWQELEAGARPGQFTVRSMPERMRALKNDPWKEFSAVKQSLTAPMKKKLGL